MSSLINVAVIIVNYNAGALLSDNLQRIISSVGQRIALKIFIVDNQSTDMSFEILSEKIELAGFSEYISLIQADKNGGFAYGNNIGIKTALESDFELDYFYLLNPDAFTLPGAIDSLITVSEHFGMNCILGSTLHNEELQARTSAFIFPNIISEFQRGASLNIVAKLFPTYLVSIPLKTKTFECDWVSGAGFFFSRSVFDKVGFLDEEYFLYYEEIDYMSHAKRQGIKIFSVPESKIVHVSGVSTQIIGNKTKNKSIPTYWYNSWHRFYFKNYSRMYAICCGIAWIKGRLINNLLSTFIKSRKRNDGHSINRFFKHALMGKRNDRE